MTTSKELVTQEQSPQPGQPMALALGQSLFQYRNNRQVLVQIMEQEMKPGVDYGITPGTQKPALWKPGAEKLASMFNFAPSFSHTLELHEDRHRTYTVKCTLKHRGTETFLGDAEAVCSTMESRYTNRKDPSDIVNPADYFNTAIKIGGKRAIVAAVLFVTAASDIFTQDFDDDDEGAGAKGANGGATRPAASVSGRGRGKDTAKAEPGLWTGELGAVNVKTYKDSNGKTQEYFLLVLKDGRSASTFDTKVAEAATKAKGQIVKITTVAGKKAGYFNAESFEVVGPSKPAEAKQSDPKPADPKPKAEDPAEAKPTAADDDENPFN